MICKIQNGIYFQYSAMRAVTLCAQYLLGLGVSLLPALALYALATQVFDVWSALRSYWQPWSDATLFATASFIVHQALHYGVMFTNHQLLGTHRASNSCPWLS